MLLIQTNKDGYVPEIRGEGAPGAPALDPRLQ